MRLGARPRSGAAARYAAAGRPARRTPWREASWCALDLELTGLEPGRDEIVAVGIVPIEAGRVRLGDARYTLVDPNRPPAVSAVLTHKLRSADLAGAPGIEAVLELVLDSLAGRVPVFHVAAVERAFLGPHLRRRGLRLPVAADTHDLGRLWLRARDGAAPEALSLERLADRLGHRPEAPHHALGDALTTAAAFIALATLLEADERPTVGSLTAAGERLRGARRMG